jgi:alanine racemase
MYTHRPTFAWIDLDALEHNFRVLRKRVGADIGILAVVKADAYGHGAAPVAATLERLGADGFGVAFAEEGIRLREGGITKPVLILGGVYHGEALKAHQYSLTPVIISLERGLDLAREARELGLRFAVHVKVDTGMTRIGIPVGEAKDAVVRLSREPELRIDGIISHFATVSPDLGADYWEQLAQFRRLLDELKAAGIDPPLKHMANTAGVLGAPKPPFNMVRPGIMLYGCYPGHGFENVLDLRPVFKLATEIFHLRRVPAGTAVSYGGTFVTPRESVIATLPLGYADGLPRALSNRGCALVRGRRAPIVGVVCMDMCMIDVTDVPDARIGDEAVFIGAQEGERIRVEEVAELCGTIPYEIFCNVNHRVGRIYVKHGAERLE